MTFAVRLLEVGASVLGRMREEDGLLDGTVNVAVNKLFVQGVLNGGYLCFLGAVGAKGRT